MLNGGMSVAEIAEVVDIGGGEQSACGEGMDGCVTPLRYDMLAEGFNLAQKKRTIVTYSFHPETAGAVHHLEEFFVFLTPEEI